MTRIIKFNEKKKQDESNSEYFARITNLRREVSIYDWARVVVNNLSVKGFIVTITHRGLHVEVDSNDARGTTFVKWHNVKEVYKNE